MDNRSVIESDEANGLVTTARTHPALDEDLLPDELAAQEIDDFSTFHYVYEVCRLLFEGAHTQVVDLLLGEVAPASTWEVLLR